MLGFQPNFDSSFNAERLFLYLKYFDPYGQIISLKSRPTSTIESLGFFCNLGQIDTTQASECGA